MVCSVCYGGLASAARRGIDVCQGGNSLGVSTSEFGAALGEPDFFIGVLNSLTDAVYLVDRERTIRFWNRAWEEVTGYLPEDVVGHRCYEEKAPG